MSISRETITGLVGERIRKLRTEQKLSQEELAFASDLNPAYIGKVERGEKCPTVETLYKIASGLNIPLCKLLDITAGTEVTDTEAFLRIQKALEGKTADEMLKIAIIIEQIADLSKKQ